MKIKFVLETGGKKVTFSDIVSKAETVIKTTAKKAAPVKEKAEETAIDLAFSIMDIADKVKGAMEDFIDEQFTEEKAAGEEIKEEFFENAEEDNPEDKAE